MSSPTDRAQAGSPSSDLTELRRDIEKVRGELADTVDALAAPLRFRTTASSD